MELKGAAALAVALTAAAGPSFAAVTVSSQNCLHLSASVKGANKRAEIKKQNANYAVNLLQEVMKTADLTQVTPGLPGTYLVQASPLKGQSSYKEKYAVIYSNTQAISGALVDYPLTAKFARPPSGVLLNDGTGSYIWFIDFHAVFGKTVKMRRDEATAMAPVYTWFKAVNAGGRTSNRIVMAGDWNLGATDAGFTSLKALSTTMKVEPNVKTSLTRAGAPSEPYDHFVYDSSKVNAGTFMLTPFPANKTPKWYRDNVSDHRGISCVIP